MTYCWWIMFLLTVFNTGVTIAKFGEQKHDEYDFADLISIAIVFFLLYGIRAGW